MTGISTLGQALDQIDQIKKQQLQFSTLSTQLSTGKKTQKFSGLGTDVLISKRARADFKSLDVYINNITNTDRRIELMLNAIEEFKAQAETFANALIGFSQDSVHQEGEVIYYDDPLTPDVEENIPVGMTSSEPDVDFETLQDLAGNLFGFLQDLLNVQDENRYLLSGAEMSTEPLGSTSTLDAAMSTLLTGWKAGTITTDELVADLQERTATAGNPDALTDTVIGFAASLSAGTAGNVFTRVGDTSEIDYTTLANDQAFRDIIVAVSYFTNDNLGPIADSYEPPNAYPGVPDAEGAPGATLDEMKDNFFQVFNELSAMVNRAIDGIDQLRFNLENVRAQMARIKEDHGSAQNLLLNTISDVEDADIDEVAVKLNSLQVSLDASYRVTARLQELSLTRFI